MTILRKFVRKLRASTAAVAATEFALATPLLLTAGLWGLETANYAITHMKVSQVAMHVSDHSSRFGDTSTLTDRKIYEADINDLIIGASIQAGQAIDLYQHGRVIISSLEVDPDDPGGTQQWIHWQRCKGLKNANSQYGGAGTGKGDPSFVGMGPPGEEIFALDDEAVMFVEIYYDYQPIVTDVFIQNKEIYVTTAFNVRADRDLNGIFQVDPASPDPVADCATFDAAIPDPPSPTFGSSP